MAEKADFLSSGGDGDDVAAATVQGYYSQASPVELSTEGRGGRAKVCSNNKYPRRDGNYVCRHGRWMLGWIASDVYNKTSLCYDIQHSVIWRYFLHIIVYPRSSICIPTYSP